MRRLCSSAVFVLAVIVSVACGTAGPLLETDGPITASVSETAFRGGFDTGPTSYRLHIRNMLGAGEGICEVNVRRKSDAVWSPNQILRPNTCYYRDQVAVLLLPTAGEWQVRVKTSASRVEKLTLRVTAATTEATLSG